MSLRAVRNAAMLFESDLDHSHTTLSSTRLALSASRLVIHATVSGGTGLPVIESGNHFLATATAPSDRAGDGSIAETSAAASTTSLSAAPLRTPPTAPARLLPVRFSAHQFNAPLASCLAQTSTNGELRRLRTCGSAAASQLAASFKSRCDHALRAVAA